MSKAGNTALVVFLVALVVLGGMVFSLSEKVGIQHRNFQSLLNATHDSLTVLGREVDSLRQLAPGLGEYMSAIQLHISKLWFAGRALNWGLAGYELNELGEAVEGAEALHAIRDSVNITGVLQSVHNTQLDLLRQSIAGRQRRAFQAAYTQTLEACNGCHRSAGYAFIHIVPPVSPPVTNQRWEPE